MSDIIFWVVVAVAIGLTIKYWRIALPIMAVVIAALLVHAWWRSQKRKEEYAAREREHEEARRRASLQPSSYSQSRGVTYEQQWPQRTTTLSTPPSCPNCGTPMAPESHATTDHVCPRCNTYHDSESGLTLDE
jgi:FtsZ-interacting cell division protein ZipA